MTKAGIVYLLTSPSGKHYVGQTRMKFSRRMITHANAASNGCNTLLGRAIRKYGLGSFEKEILLEAPIKSLNKLERHYVAKFSTMSPNGYNLSSGGGVGRTCSDITRKKMSEARKGDKNPNYGKKHSAETLEKIGAASKGRRHSRETKEKIADASRQMWAERSLKHGTLSTYSRHKCKCEECLKVGRAYNREAYEKRKLSDDPIKHGTAGYRRGCRCEECREARKVSRVLNTLIIHGKLDSYNSRGCRCMECKAVKSAYSKAQYQRLKKRA